VVEEWAGVTGDGSSMSRRQWRERRRGMLGGVEAFSFSFELENGVEALKWKKTRREGRQRERQLLCPGVTG